MSNEIVLTPAGSSTTRDGSDESQATQREIGQQVAYASFDMYRDDPEKLSWLDRKRLARTLGIVVTNRMKWEQLQPKVKRRIEALKYSNGWKK